MMMKRAAALLLIAVVCAFASGTGPEGETRVRVFETSDIHGCLMDTSSGREEAFQYRLARIARLVEEGRSDPEVDAVLLLDGGDVYQGTPVSDRLRGSEMRAAMDAMGYDAVALGNHEFDWDVETYAADPDATVPAYDLGAFSGDPVIPVLAGGLTYAADGKSVPFTRDHVIVEKAGLRIALIGYIPDFSRSVLTEKIAPYRIDGSFSSLRARIRAVQTSEKPDVTVVVAHADATLVAEALDPRQVHLVTGGHKHQGVAGAAKSGVPYIQADSSARGYASADIVVSPDGSVRVETSAYTSVTLDRASLYDRPENRDLLDRKILLISHAAWELAGGGMGEVLGRVTASVSRTVPTGDNGSTAAGNFLTGLMLRAVRDTGAVIAFYNSGGIRTSLNVPRGQASREITVGDIYTIAPFGNRLMVYDLTGAELKRQLTAGLENSNYGDQMSGLTFEYIDHGTLEEPDPEILSIALDDGTVVDTEDTLVKYRVCVSSYSATLPGSVFEGKTPLRPEEEAPVDNEAFIRALRDISGENGGFIPVDLGPRGILSEAADGAA